MLVLAAALAGCSPANREGQADQIDISATKPLDDVATSSITAPGVVDFRRRTRIGFTTGGRILSVDVNVGDRVRPGQLLARLDTAIVNSDLSIARAEEARARADYERNVKLLRDGWVTRTRVEALEADLRTARARTSAARFQMSNATLRAAQSAVVTSRIAEPGETIPANTPVLTLGLGSEGIVFRCQLRGKEVSKIGLRRVALIDFGEFGTKVAGSVIEIAGSEDRDTGLYETLISIPVIDGLRPGATGYATIQINPQVPTEANTFRLPFDALFAVRGGEGFVFVIDPRTHAVRARKVQLRTFDAETAHIVSGLTSNDLVATSQIERLRAGARVGRIRTQP